MTKEEMDLVMGCVLDKIIYYRKKKNKEMEEKLKTILVKLGAL